MQLLARRTVTPRQLTAVVAASFLPQLNTQARHCWKNSPIRHPKVPASPQGSREAPHMHNPLLLHAAGTQEHAMTSSAAAESTPRGELERSDLTTLHDSAEPQAYLTHVADCAAECLTV